jgi:hypothetical protein
MTNVSNETVQRASGKTSRYDIGTTAAVSKGSDNFLCVVLTKTDTSTLEVKASASDLLKAVHGLLTKARSECSNQPLNIPLIGSGLGRVGIKPNILVDLILVAVFEETKLNKITNEIRIILPIERISDISLDAIKKDWS